MTSPMECESLEWRKDVYTQKVQAVDIKQKER